MNERRLLDATHITEIFLWTLSRRGDVSIDHSGLGEIIARLGCRKPPSIDMHLRARDIERLAAQLLWYTAITYAFDSPEILMPLLAQIALIVNQNGPKVSELSTIPDVITPLIGEIRTEFAVACVIAYASDYGYLIDARKISQDEIYNALLKRDETALTRIFENALSAASGTKVRGRHARSEDLQLGTEKSADAFLLQLEEQFADANPVPSPGMNVAERQLSATKFRILCSLSEFEGWSAQKVLKRIDEHLRSCNIGQGMKVTPRRLEGQIVDANSIRTSGSNGAERQLPASSYWNLRSIAELESWSAEVVLTLISEHLNPTLLPYFVHYSDSSSGPDWLRLHAWVFRANGGVLWSVLWNVTAESSHR
jgi:hypothetical protein